MADIFDEVNEDLRAERAQQFAKRYGGVLAGLALVAVLGVGGWQYWRQSQAHKADAVASTFLTAMRTATPPAAGVLPEAARTTALESFTAISGTAPDGYRALARLRAAALRVAAGDRPGALALWDQLSADTTADPLLRDLASLLWVQHQVDDGDPAAVEGRVQPLLAAGNAWRPLAVESLSLLMIRTGQADRARELLRGLIADAAAPDNVRGRANGLLTRLGEPPAPPRAAGAGG